MTAGATTSAPAASTSAMDASRRALLIHFGQLGDAVMALPAAVALRAQTPGAAWTVLAARGADAIFAMAGFTSVLTADRVRWKHRPATAFVDLPALLWRLRRSHFSLSVDLHSYKETNLLAFLAGIPERVAMLRPTRSWPRLISRKPVPDDPGGRLIDRYCAVVAALGVTVPDRVPHLDPPAADRARLAALFANWSAAAGPEFGNAPILGICPGAGHPSRRWPQDRFAALARALQLSAPARIAIFAGPEESTAALAPFIGLPHAQIWRGLTIPELAAALAHCRVVVTNPTGPSHIAAAVGARVLTLGEIPAFDPVSATPGAVVPLRAFRLITDIQVPEAAAALLRLWT